VRRQIRRKLVVDLVKATDGFIPSDGSGITATEGLIILANDGDLQILSRLLSNLFRRSYEVKVKRPADDEWRSINCSSVVCCWRILQDAAPADIKG